MESLMCNQVDLSKVHVGDMILVDGYGWCTIVSLSNDTPDSNCPLHPYYVRFRTKSGSFDWWTYEQDGTRPASSKYAFEILDVLYIQAGQSKITNK